MSLTPTTLRPNKKLLVISSIALVLWVGMLVWIYAKWVWPTRTSGVPATVEQSN